MKKLGNMEPLVRQLIAQGRLPPDALERAKRHEPVTLGVASRVPEKQGSSTGAASIAVGKPATVRRSKTEERYEALLLAEGHRPLYEPLRLRIDLATGSHRYRPDFLIVVDDVPELHEVKGGFQGDQRARDWMRFEMAVDQWGWLFTFVWAQWRDRQWTLKKYPRRAVG